MKYKLGCEVIVNTHIIMVTLPAQPVGKKKKFVVPGSVLVLMVSNLSANYLGIYNCRGLV